MYNQKETSEDKWTAFDTFTLLLICSTIAYFGWKAFEKFVLSQ